MAIATLITITMACIAWSLWIRRVTWSCRWEVAATLNIALQGLAVLLMSPLASQTIANATVLAMGAPSHRASSLQAARGRERRTAAHCAPRPGGPAFPTR